jgi:hypothetical protein
LDEGIRVPAEESEVGLVVPKEGLVCLCFGLVLDAKKSQADQLMGLSEGSSVICRQRERLQGQLSHVGSSQEWQLKVGEEEDSVTLSASAGGPSESMNV